MTITVQQLEVSLKPANRDWPRSPEGIQVEIKNKIYTASSFNYGLDADSKLIVSLTCNGGAIFNSETELKVISASNNVLSNS